MSSSKTSAEGFVRALIFLQLFFFLAYGYFSCRVFIKTEGVWCQFSAERKCKRQL
jgi:hypothetical protein